MKILLTTIYLLLSVQMCLAQEQKSELLLVYDIKPLTESQLRANFGKSLRIKNTSCDMAIVKESKPALCKIYSANNVHFLDIDFDTALYLENKVGVIYRVLALRAGDCSEVTESFFKLSRHISSGEARPLDAKVTVDKVWYDIVIPTGTHKLKSNRVSLEFENKKCTLSYEFVRNE